MNYIHEQPDWPKFHWDHDKLALRLAEVRLRQGRLFGRMEALGFAFKNDAILQTLTLDVLKSSEIEGEKLNRDQVRSSIARRLGTDIGCKLLFSRKLFRSLVTQTAMWTLLVCPSCCAFFFCPPNRQEFRKPIAASKREIKDVPRQRRHYGAVRRDEAPKLSSEQLRFGLKTLRLSAK